MSDENSGMGEAHPHVEADAVCEQCDTVNPPGSLICKTCGNNLRDQLLSREIGEVPYEVAEEPAAHPRRILSGLLGVFGLLVILWTALNVNRIESMLAEGFTTPVGGAATSYWAQPRAAVYDELLRELRRNPIRPEEIEGALAAPTAGEFRDGRYVLTEVDDAGETAAIGEAQCLKEGEAIYFVARLREGSVEVRGRAGLRSGGVLEAAVVGVRGDGFFGEGKGIAERSDDGGFTCYGISADGGNRFQVAAYRIP